MWLVPAGAGGARSTIHISIMSFFSLVNPVSFSNPLESKTIGSQQTTGSLPKMDFYQSDYLRIKNFSPKEIDKNTKDERHFLRKSLPNEPA